MNEQKIEKPKINVDADSIIVDENITDDEFFDDFLVMIKPMWLFLFVFI